MALGPTWTHTAFPYEGKNLECKQRLHIKNGEFPLSTVDQLLQAEELKKYQTCSSPNQEDLLYSLTLGSSTIIPVTNKSTWNNDSGIKFVFGQITYLGSLLELNLEADNIIVAKVIGFPNTFKYGFYQCCDVNSEKIEVIIPTSNIIAKMCYFLCNNTIYFCSIPTAEY